MRVWVYYNRATGEATIYGAEPPALFGRRQYDIGPIELDEGLIARYAEAKDAWRAAQTEFTASVRAAEDPTGLDGRVRSNGYVHSIQSTEQWGPSWTGRR